MKTALVWHEKLMWFDTGTFAGPMPVGGWVQPGEASENPEAKRRIKNLLDATGMDVRYVESRDGHNWENWRDRLREGLSWLYPGPLRMVYE